MVAGGILLLGMVQAPAAAEDAPVANGMGSKDRPPLQSTTVSDGEQRKVATPSCTVYANANGMGLDCVAGGRAGTSLLEIINRYKLPACWHEPLPLEWRDQLPAVPGPEVALPAVEKLEVCLEGVKPHPTEAGQWVEEPGETPTISRTAVWVTITDVVPPVPGTEAVIDEETEGYPDLVLVSGPGSPRVNVPTYFWLSSETERTKSVGGVTLRARLVTTEVFPRGEEHPLDRAECPGPGEPVERNDVLREHGSGASIPSGVPGGCEVIYTRASPVGGYEVKVRGYWRVSYSVNEGDPVDLAQFPTDETTLVDVDEIQTIVG